MHLILNALFKIHVKFLLFVNHLGNELNKTCFKTGFSWTRPAQSSFKDCAKRFGIDASLTNEGDMIQNIQLTTIENMCGKDEEVVLLR